MEVSKISPRDVFMHLLAIAALYISAVSFGALIFRYIDLLFPDPLTDLYSNPRDSVRWATAALTVVFPVYVWQSWFLVKDSLRHPVKRELKIRKWLLYFTLFVAAVVILGDLVAVIYKFLSGDLSSRFLLKVLTILFIAAAVFVYYLWNLRQEVSVSRNKLMAGFVWGVVAVVVISAIGGFFVSGSPFRERMRKFDERRIQDLQTIQWQVVNYWQRKERLPENVAMLRDDISGFVVPQDPESKAPYEYQVLGNFKFMLCADFKTESGGTEKEVYRMGMPVPYGGEMMGSWMHGIGKVCFERSIDPELYPPTEKVKR